MKFPMINITEDSWSNKHVLDNMLFEPWIYNDNNANFEKHFKGALFCDCRGEVYRVIDKRGEGGWKKWFGFLPNFYRVHLVFEKVDQPIELNTVKELLKKHNPNSALNKTIDQAQTFEELLNG